MKRNFFKVFVPLVLVGASAGLAACGGGSGSRPSSGEIPGINVDPDDHNEKGIELCCYFPNFGASNDKVQNGVLANLIRETTTYKVQFNQLSESAADTEINNLLSMKEPVDMLKCAPTVFNNYVTGGYFTDLTPFLSQERYGGRIVDSEGTKFKDLFTDEQWEACTYNGKIYAIPEYGHSIFTSQALVWNKDHLKIVGITKIPETLTEFNTAVHALQEHFGTNSNYHAFGLTGNIAQDNTISPAFGVPMQWWEDSDGNLQHMLFSTEMENYLRYMNSLRRENIIVSDWVGQGEVNAMSNFTKELCSVYCGSYWNIKDLRSQLVGAYQSFPKVKVGETERPMNDTEKKEYVRGKASFVSLKDDALVSWRVSLRGDGYANSKVQKQGMFRDNRTVGFYITVPITNAARTAYTLDWVIRKNYEECTKYVVAGKEGLHYDYCEASDEGAIKLNTDPAKYVKKYDCYDDDISGMEQFQTACNGKYGRRFWPLAEAGFDAWNCLVVNEKGEEDFERVISNPFGIHPVIEKFAKYDLKAQNESITKVQYCINAKDDDVFATRLNSSRDTYKTKYYDKFSADINAWYKSKDK